MQVLKKMKRRVFTLFLSLIILWGSLAAYSHKTFASDVQQFRPSSESVTVAIAPKFHEGVQVNTDFLLATAGSISLVKAHALHDKILYISPSIRKSVKAYIIFRVFRN